MPQRRGCDRGFVTFWEPTSILQGLIYCQLRTQRETLSLFTSPSEFPPNYLPLSIHGTPSPPTPPPPPLLALPAGTANGTKQAKTRAKPQAINSLKLPSSVRLSCSEWRKELSWRKHRTRPGCRFSFRLECSSLTLCGWLLITLGPLRGHLFRAAFAGHPTGVIPSHSGPSSALFS